MYTSSSPPSALEIFLSPMKCLFHSKQCPGNNIECPGFLVRFNLPFVNFEDLSAQFFKGVPRLRVACVFIEVSVHECL